jgi:oligopeptide transport system permease protein
MTIVAPGEVLAEVGEIRGRSLWQDARRRLLRNRAAVVSMIVLGLIAGLALFAPWLSPHPYDEIYWERILAPPDLEHAH